MPLDYHMIFLYAIRILSEIIVGGELDSWFLLPDI